MFPNFDRKFVGQAVLAILLLVVLYFFFRILQPFLPPIIWAAILATVFYPMHRWLDARVRRPRLAGFLSCMIVILVIVLPVLVILILLAGESVQGYRLLSTRLDTGELRQLESFRQSASYQWLLGKMQILGVPEPDLRQVVLRLLRQFSEFLVGHSTALLSGLGRVLLNFFVMVLSLYYMFTDGPTLLGDLRQLVPLSPANLDRIVAHFKDVSVATLGGGLLTAIIQGGVGGLVFLIFGVPSPLLWGAVMALLSLLPLVGTPLVWGPVVVYYFLTGAVVKGLLFLAVCAGIVSSVDNVVRPLLIGHRVQINTLWVFVGVLGGVGAMGFLGIVLGPLIISLFFVLVEIFKTESPPEPTTSPE